MNRRPPTAVKALIDKHTVQEQLSRMRLLTPTKHPIYLPPAAGTRREDRP